MSNRCISVIDHLLVFGGLYIASFPGHAVGALFQTLWPGNEQKLGWEGLGTRLSELLFAFKFLRAQNALAIHNSRHQNPAYGITVLKAYAPTYIPPWKTGLGELTAPSWLSRLSVSAVIRLARGTMGDSWIASLPIAERGSNKD